MTTALSPGIALPDDDAMPAACAAPRHSGSSASTVAKAGRFSDAQRPPPCSHTLFTVASPRASRASFTGCVCHVIWISVSSRFHTAASRPVGQHRVQRLAERGREWLRVQLPFARRAQEPAVAEAHELGARLGGECVGGGDQRVGVVVSGWRGQRPQRHVIAREFEVHRVGVPQALVGRRRVAGEGGDRIRRGGERYFALEQVFGQPREVRRRLRLRIAGELRAREHGGQSGRGERLGERVRDFARQQGARQQQRDMHRPILRSLVRAPGAVGAGCERAVGYNRPPFAGPRPNATP